MMRRERSEYAKSSRPGLCVCDVHKTGMEFLHKITNLRMRILLSRH